MKTLAKANLNSLKKAAKIIKNGGVVAFPTETVYGLGANAFNAKAAARIFEIKNRPHFDPLIVHIADYSQLDKVAAHFSKKARKLARIFWPGPLTLILPKKEALPDIVTAGLKTVAVRMPACKTALELIKKSGTPIAAPSANSFSRLSPTKAAHVYSHLKNKPDMILDGGKTLHGIESTIIKEEGKKLFLLREGAIAAEDINQKTGYEILKIKNKKIEAPGQIKKHYAPKAKIIFVKPNQKISDKKAAYLAFFEKPKGQFKIVKILSKNKNLKEAAANLFDFLHKMEKKKVLKIYAEKVPDKGLGAAINDRLSRAAK